MITGYLETKADPMTHFHFYFFEDFFKEKRGKEKGYGVYSLGARCNSSTAKSEQRFIPSWRWDCCSYA
jgi:hypothetical protein